MVMFNDLYRFIGEAYPVGAVLMFGFLMAIRHRDRHYPKDNFIIADDIDGIKKYAAILVGTLLWPATLVAVFFIFCRAVYIRAEIGSKALYRQIFTPKPNPEWITKDEARAYAREFAAQYIRDNMVSQDAVKKLVQQQVQAYQKDVKENVLPALIRHELLNTHIPGLDLAKRKLDVE